MDRDVLGGQVLWPMTNVRNLGLKPCRALAATPEKRCVVPLTEFCEWTPEKHDMDDGEPPVNGSVVPANDQPKFAIARFLQRTETGNGFTMVTCDPNEPVGPIHPKAMQTILHVADIDNRLRGSYDERTARRQSYDAAAMTVRGPNFMPVWARASLLATLRPGVRSERH